MRLPILLALTSLATSCTANPPVKAPIPENGVVQARIGQTVYIDGPHLTPLAVIEDSRCPTGVQCVWAGQVKVRVKIDLGPGSQLRELVLGDPQQIADGSIELVEVTPAMHAKAAIPPGDYRFGFRFMGGL
ncbi:hypothetical protein MB02_04750 [Croceicoccus estronivorus]|nr:hypothetical protein MB02_04750 [Croceicoccus estronivorus]